MHCIQQGLRGSVIVLRKLPHENPAQMFLAYRILHFFFGRGWIVVGDKTERREVGIQQIRGLGQTVPVFSPSQFQQLLDLRVGDGRGSLIATQIMIRAKKPQAFDVKRVTAKCRPRLIFAAGTA